MFTKGASNGLNMVALGFGMDYIQEGDEIITTELEHHSNVLPWMNVAKKKNATLKYIELDSTGRITVEAFKKTITEKSKVLAITYVSNVMGYITPIKEIIKIAHEHNIIVVVDAAQAVPHMKVDVQDLDCDFLAFSAHKMFGPTGFGILFGKYKYLKKMSPIEYGGDMIDVVEKYEATTKDAPYKFETGTPPIAEAIAFKEAIKYIESIGYDRIHEHEQILLNYAREKLSKVEGITIYNPTAETAIITFNINKAHPHDAATIFDEYHVALRAGHHCAQLITKWLDCVATLRACIYVYNDYHDIKIYNIIMSNVWKLITFLLIGVLGGFLFEHYSKYKDFNYMLFSIVLFAIIGIIDFFVSIVRDSKRLEKAEKKKKEKELKKDSDEQNEESAE